MFWKKRNWDLLPQEFIQRLKNKLGDQRFKQLTEIGKRHNMFEQPLFKKGENLNNNTPLIFGPPGCTMDMYALSSFLSSMGISLAKMGDKKNLADGLSILEIASIIMPENPVPHVMQALVFVSCHDLKSRAKKQAEIALSFIEKWPKEINQNFDEIKNQMYNILNDKYEIEKGDLQAFERGVSYMDRGEWQRAINSFVEFLKNQPSNTSAWYNLALSYVYLKDLNAAEKALLEAISLEPNFSEALNSLGYIYNQKNEWVKATEVLEKTININPLYGDAWFNLGLTIIYSGYKKQYDIQTIIKRLSTLDPNSANSLKNLLNQTK